MIFISKLSHMKSLINISIISLLILSCNNSTGSMGCEDGLGGYTYLDECGVCGGDNFGENIYTDDVCGTCSVGLWTKCFDIISTKSITFRGHGIEGEIPVEIGNLINLETIELSGNFFDGEIPLEITQLINLERLFLQYNQLTENIPSEIGNLTNLVFLCLDNNQLTGEIPLEILNLNIYNLYLNTNQLSGIIPEQLCDQVYQIYIGNNQLCPPYPSCISGSDIDSQDTSNCP